MEVAVRRMVVVPRVLGVAVAMRKSTRLAETAVADSGTFELMA